MMRVELAVAWFPKSPSMGHGCKRWNSGNRFLPKDSKQGNRTACAKVRTNIAGTSTQRPRLISLWHQKRLRWLETSDSHSSPLHVWIKIQFLLSPHIVFLASFVRNCKISVCYNGFHTHTQTNTHTHTLRQFNTAMDNSPFWWCKSPMDGICSMVTLPKGKRCN